MIEDSHTLSTRGEDRPEAETTFVCPHCDYPMTPGICPECGREAHSGGRPGPALSAVLKWALIAGSIPVWMTPLELVCGRKLYGVIRQSYIPGDARWGDASFAVLDILKWSHLLLLPLLFMATTLLLARRSRVLRRSGAARRVVEFGIVGLAVFVTSWAFGGIFLLMAFMPD